MDGGKRGQLQKREDAQVDKQVDSEEKEGEEEKFRREKAGKEDQAEVSAERIQF